VVNSFLQKEQTMNLKPFFLLCCLAVSTIVVAQTKPAKPVAKPVQKFIPPKLKTSLGAANDTVITTTAEGAARLVNLPLLVTDGKKGVYTISTYQCMYKRKGVTEDEESGKVSPATTIVVQRFTTTPVSEIWRKTIAEQLKPGEEISFFDIVVKDAQNRLMFAPSLKIIVK
jgi:hypothetical protein